MEVLFENSYTRDEKLIKEIYRYEYFRRKLLIIFDIVMILCLLSNILILVVEKKCYWGVFILAPLYFLYKFFCYWCQVRIIIKRDQEVHGKEISVETIVTNEYIQNTASTGTVNKLEYENIRNVVQTNNLILLRSKANLVYIFQKDAFTIGNAEDFIKFLKDKGIKVK